MVWHVPINEVVLKEQGFCPTLAPSMPCHRMWTDALTRCSEFSANQANIQAGRTRDISFESEAHGLIMKAVDQLSTHATWSQQTATAIKAGPDQGAQIFRDCATLLVLYLKGTPVKPGQKVGELVVPEHFTRFIYRLPRPALDQLKVSLTNRDPA